MLAALALFALLFWASRTPTLTDVRHLRTRRVTARIAAGELAYGSVVTVLVGASQERQSVVLGGPADAGGWFRGLAEGGPLGDGAELPFRGEHVYEIQA